LSRNASTVRDLVSQWHTEAETLRNRFRDERGAFLVGRMASELEEALRSDDAEPLTLDQAAKCSGYSSDHLGRLIRNGKLPNAGRPNAPRVRRGDVPTKVSHLRDDLHTGQIAPYSRTQIARSIVNPEQH